MSRYRFTAADSFGVAHDGTIDAPTAAAARNKLASNGLAVRTVEEIASPAGVIAPELRAKATQKSDSSILGPNPIRPRTFDAKEPATRRGGSPLALVFSLLALLISLGTAAYTLTRDPMKNRLAKYDFTTPEAAYLSSVRMAADGDYLARFERESKLIGPQAREQFATTEIRYEKTEKYKGKVALFVTYRRNGRTRNLVRWFEQDPESKMWKRSWMMESETALNPDGMPHDLAEKIRRFVTPADPADALMQELDW